MHGSSNMACRFERLKIGSIYFGEGGVVPQAVDHL